VAAASELNGGVLSLAVVATNDPGANVLAYAARETNGIFAPRLRILTTNDFQLSATQSFRVVVAASNQPPVVTPVPVATAQAGAPFALSVSAQDPDEPPRQLAYVLASAPEGAVIDSETGLITWTPAPGMVGTSNEFTVVVIERGWGVIAPAEADTFVRSGFGLNYGASEGIEVRLAGPTTTREGLLRFSVPRLQGAVREATVRLASTTVAHTSLVHAVAATVTNAWHEAGVTWNDRPGYGPWEATWKPALSAGPDVSDLVRTALGGDGVVSLAVVATNDPAANVLTYWSREGSTNFGPRLSVTYTNGFERSSTQSFWVMVLPAVIPAPSLMAPSVVAGRFGFTVTGAAGFGYAVQASSNLVHWQTVFTTNAATLPFSWREPGPAAEPARFFRVLAGPWP
jgi:hypothetical protein